MQSNAWAAKVDTLEIYSNAMLKVIRCLVITPSNYQPTQNPYPVLYLLHGWSGNYSSWLSDAPQLVQHADAHQMLIVCPGSVPRQSGGRSFLFRWPRLEACLADADASPPRLIE